MIAPKATLTRLLNHDFETETLEFKEAKNKYSLKKIGKYFSALANEANLKGQDEAWLIFGVRDKDKVIVGTQYRKDPAHLHNLKKEIADQTNQNLAFRDIHDIETEQGRVILFQIPPAPQGIPVAWQGHFYGRDGESIGPLNMDEIEQIRRQAVAGDWSKTICAEATLDDLSATAIKRARELFAQKNPTIAGDIKGWEDTTFLNKAKICIKGKITHTAILLLGKPESEHFLESGLAKISWILKDRDNIEKDYAHFSCPFLLHAEDVCAKIRNLTYRYLAKDSLFPQEVDSYHPYIIREALNNCIAHQDYTLGGKINVVEREDRKLIFVNMGSFIPQTIEHVIEADAPEELYRNPFLAGAMVNLKMIDTMGSGIKRMFNIQRQKFFPLPEYNFQNNKVEVSVLGKVLDLNYAKKLAQMPNLSLIEIMLLDKVQKNKSLADNEIKKLRRKKLIEGRKPNFHISAEVADQTDQQTDYSRLRGIDDDFCQEMILNHLLKFKSGKKSDFEKILLDKLPDILSENQKKDRLRYLLQKLRKASKIVNYNRTWHLADK